MLAFAIGKASNSGYASGLSCLRSPTLQVGVLLRHIGVKIVLPLCQIVPVAYDFFGAQAIVFPRSAPSLFHKALNEMAAAARRINRR